ncbi:MAG: hypothetical protein JWP01_3435 [Myxococcales bacterium]|nr:hypothetical protein [Myxococcales bacterium]
MVIARAASGRYDGESWVAPLPDATITALSRLVGALNLQEREPLTLEAASAIELRDAHARAHSGTPAFDTVARLFGLNNVTDERLIFRPKDELLDRAAATLWLELTRDPTTTRASAFDLWFARVGGDGAIDAAGHLAKAARSALLDEMVERLFAENDLGDYAAEWSRVLVDEEDLGASLGSPPQAPSGDDLVEILPWWKRVDRLIGEPASGEMRSDVSSLVLAVIRHDPLDGAYASRGARIVRLLGCGHERVFLLRSVANAILRSRPEAIATLLARVELQRLGLQLLADVGIDDDAFVGWTDEQQYRRSQRIRLAWSEGASIALEVLAALPIQQAAERMAQLLLPLAIEATADLTYTVQRQPRADAEVRLEETLRLLDALETSHSVNGHQLRVLPKIATQLVAALHRLTTDESVPIGALRLLFGFLDVDPSAAAVAAIGVLRAWLTSGPNGWSHDHRAVAAFAWDRVVRVVDNTAFDAFVTTTPGQLEDDEWAVANRHRLLLRVLAKAHSGIANRNAPTAAETARRDRIEASIISQLAANAPLEKYDPANVFGRLLEGSTIGTNVEELTFVAARSVDTFAPIRRDEAIDRWLGVSRDPVLLLRAASAMHAAHAREVVEGRLIGVDLVTELATESTVSIAGMAEEAVSLRFLPLAKSLLAAGDTLFDNDRLRERWRDDSLRPRLAMLALTGDQPGFDALASTAKAGTDFQRGLLALHVDQPAEAVRLFKHLVRDNPRSAPAQVNLFSARIRMAGLLEPPERQQGIEAAIFEWKRAESSFREEDRERVAATAAYNMLLALGELARTHDFDATLQNLSPAVRYSRSVAALAIDTWKQRGADAKASALLAEAEAHHGRVEWIELLKAEMSVGAPTATAPPVVVAVERPLNAGELRVGVLEALSRNPEQMAAIFGNATDLEGLLRELHVEAAEEMLLLEATLVDLRDEDKFNHIYAKLLAGRLRFLRWSVSEGSPGGVSDGTGAVKGTAGGEGWRDWVIKAGTQELCVGEALRCNGGVDPKYIEDHVNKLARYDPIGRSFAFLVAYIELAYFDRGVEKYRSAVANATLVDFPVVRTDEMVTGPIRLKTFRSVHRRTDTEITVHHLLIGLPRPKGSAGKT